MSTAHAHCREYSRFLADIQRSQGDRGVGRLTLTACLVNDSRKLLQHFLAALAYRTQKALRGAPPEYADLRIAPRARTPREIVWHMTGVIGYARTFLHGGDFAPPKLAQFDAEVARFHETLRALHEDFGNESLAARISDEQFLQGPLADAMTHAGQLAMLRRLAGSPVASENFIFAGIRSDNVSAQQPEPSAPDHDWTPERGHRPPGPKPAAKREKGAGTP